MIPRFLSVSLSSCGNGMYRQKIARDRLVFDDEVLADMADIFSDGDPFEGRQGALGQCIEKLTPSHRNLLRIRYTDGVSVKDMADRLNKSANAIAKTLHRTRIALMECIERRVSEGGV